MKGIHTYIRPNAINKQLTKTIHKILVIKMLKVALQCHRIFLKYH